MPDGRCPKTSCVTGSKITLITKIKFEKKIREKEKRLFLSLSLSLIFMYVMQQSLGRQAAAGLISDFLLRLLLSNINPFLFAAAGGNFLTFNTLLFLPTTNESVLFLYQIYPKLSLSLSLPLSLNSSTHTKMFMYVYINHHCGRW